MNVLSAFRLDGQSSRRTPVTLDVIGELLAIDAISGRTLFRLEEVRLDPPLGSAPRMMRLPDGSHLEISDHSALHRLLPELSTSGLLHRLEATWITALGALVLTALIVGAAYVWGLPWVAKQAAMLVPETWNRQLGSATMDLLDHMGRGPTGVSPDRQDQLRHRLLELTPPTRIEGRPILHFRNFGPVANAFALPSGDIIITDALVLAAPDDQILAVLAHELGHVAMRHSLRALLQSAGVSMIISTLSGDFSHLASLSAGLLNLSYSRDMEREADDYSLRMLTANAMPPRLLAEALGTLRTANANATEAPASCPTMLSSHPDLDERIAHALIQR